jgi:hypothetical protein
MFNRTSTSIGLAYQDQIQGVKGTPYDKPLFELFLSAVGTFISCAVSAIEPEEIDSKKRCQKHESAGYRSVLKRVYKRDTCRTGNCIIRN